MNFNAKLERISEICVQFGITNFSVQLDVLKNIVKSADFIDVGIFGRFKAGKSSFLDNLLGSKVLPVGVIPVTAVITKIKYGEKGKIAVTFQRGSNKEILINEIPEYVCENFNPQNEKKVYSVEITLPEMLQYKDLQFVDTPGLGSIFTHNTKTSFDWLPNAGVALVAISVDPPLSEQDIALLREILKYTPKVIILLTKVDLLSDTEIKEIEKYVKESLRKEFGREFSIYQYSIYKNNKRFKMNLDEQLLFPLMSRKDKEQEEISKHKMNFLSGSCIEYLKLAEQSADKLQSQKDILKEILDRENANLTNTIKELEILTNYYIIYTRNWLNENLKKYHSGLSKKLQNELENILPQWRGSMLKVSRIFELWLREQITAETNIISSTENRNFNQFVERLKSSYKNKVDSFRDKLSHDIKTTLGIEFNSLEFSTFIEESDFKDISLFRTFDFSLNLFWYLMPTAIFRPLLKYHLKNSVYEEVEKNIFRLAAQWESKIVSIIKEMKKQSEEYMRNEIATILNVILHKDNKLDDIRDAIKVLELMKKEN